MKSHSMLTIFSSYPDGRGPFVPLVFSILVHGITFGAILSVLIRAPRILLPHNEDRYSARYLELNRFEFQLRRLRTTEIGQMDPPANGRPRVDVTDQLSAYVHHPHPIASSLTGGRQTLLQADLPKPVDVSIELPLPQFVIWKAHPVIVHSIVAPLPEASHASDALPSILTPNEEPELGNISLTATTLPSSNSQSRSATTSPLAVHNGAETQKAPATVSQTSDKPTPVAILSLSALRMSNGKAVLPPVNETTGEQAQGTSSPTQATTPSPMAIGMDGATSPIQKSQNSVETPSAGSGSTESGSAQHSPASPQVNLSALGLEQETSATLIRLPKDGQFAAVVVGTSPDDRFPDIQQRWNGRLIYTVYLHVGLARSWILQYSLPPMAEATAGGTIAHLNAPWPYSMVRPDLDFGSIDADALIVNGSVTQDGTFEKLSLISPPSFPNSDFVIHCLQRWKFRPAIRDGHYISVEVMLIIPTPLS